MDHFRTYLQEKEAYQNTLFCWDDFEVGRDHVHYQGKIAAKIIFCEGIEALNSTFFDWLPFTLVKGELLFVETDTEIHRIFNRGVFMIPTEKERCCKVGSTYDHQDLSKTVTAKGREKIIDLLDNLYRRPYKIIGQRAGIRPATKDRRPFVGMHPQYKHIGIFNGLGTKGVSLAPYFASQFARYLENGHDMEREVNINRFF